MNSSAPPMCRDIIQGIDRIRPFAFAARLTGPAQTTGFPSTAKRLHLYICVHSRIGNMFQPTPLRGYIRSALHRHTATRLQDYTPPPSQTGEGSPMGALRPCSYFFERGAVGASRSASTGYRLINTNLTSRTNDKEAKLNRSRTETSKTLVFQSRTQPSTANKKNSRPIHSVTEEINFA